MSPMAKMDYIWFNGELVEWDKATIHVLSHVVHYGSSVFEGVRCYETPRGPAIFRLRDHTRRLFNSAKIYRMELPYTEAQINQAAHEVIAANKLRSAYLRPVAFRGYGQLGVDPRTCPVDVAIAAMNWGKYLGDEALEQGVDVGVSSWSRFAPNTLPAMAKAAANYMNSQLIKLEAAQHGYSEGIALDVDGYISEGSGENIFMVHNGQLVTPPLNSSVLPGITRDCIITLAREHGIVLVESRIPREALYLADELFFTGTAAEVTPIRSVDGIQIGAGKRGPITEQLQQAFFNVISGETPDRWGWLEYAS
ncbi:MAG: branched-chain amino acid transaminase [Chloroflexota bacterium]|nr:branched-chain amino acid transaminase [Chloroflexota bacterium]PLS79838.1 MAG: branched chain amino acid aminotransferase [Chloroflexota bacterium]